jgi:hypothetical protein
VPCEKNYEGLTSSKVLAECLTTGSQKQEISL